MSASRTKTNELKRQRLPLPSDTTIDPMLTGPAAKLPPINVFRALANAPTLAPDFLRYFAHLFEPLELDSRIERLIVLLTGKLSGCEYVWRQNVVVAKSLGIPDQQIVELEKGHLEASCFDIATKAAFRFGKETLELIEVTASTYAEAEKYFSPRAITEILYVVGSYMLLSRLIRTGGIPLDDKPAEVPPGLLK